MKFIIPAVTISAVLLTGCYSKDTSADDAFALGALVFRHPDLMMADDFLARCPVIM